MDIGRQIQIAQLHIDEIVCRIGELSILENRHDIPVSLFTELHYCADLVVYLWLIRAGDVEQLSREGLFYE